MKPSCRWVLIALVACAQDADSATPEGEKAEGAFYIWAADEIDEVLGTDSERARLFGRHYYVKPAGNVDLSRRRCVPVQSRSTRPFRVLRCQS